MRRLHLAEIEDQPWLPAPIRDGATDYLQFILARTQPYRPIAPRLAQALNRAGQDRVIDLCSGAGGPWPALLEQVSSLLGKPLAVCLTDRYPNLPAWQRLHKQTDGRITFEEQSVDARYLPASLGGFRTLFSGFHHFTPEDATRILLDAVKRGQGIAIFEATERAATSLIGMLFVPILIALVTPIIRPFRWSRLLWTYPLPAIPIIGLVDGVISCLRTYRTEELRKMATPLEQYTWDIGQERGPQFPIPVTYLIGTPA